MKENQFPELIVKIDELLAESNINSKRKDKLLKAKSLLLSRDKINWEKGLILLGKIITGANTLYSILDSIWDWIRNLF